MQMKRSGDYHSIDGFVVQHLMIIFAAFSARVKGERGIQIRLVRIAYCDQVRMLNVQ